MKPIDADAFSQQVAAMAIKENYTVEKANAMIKLINMQPVIDPAQLLLTNCQGCVHDNPGVECLHCMRAYSDCYFKP